MNRSRVIYLSILAVVLIVLLTVIIYYFFYGRISADSSYGTESSRINKNWDLNSDGDKELISLIKYQNGKNNNFILSAIVSNKYYSIVLSGFESEVGFCQNYELLSLPQYKIICISGYVGAHSENIQLISFQNNILKPVEFINNQISQNRVVSDAPNYGFSDINNDNLIEFYIDNRDYEKDPTLDFMRSYYYFINGAYSYNHIESMRNNEQVDVEGSVN